MSRPPSIRIRLLGAALAIAMVVLGAGVVVSRAAIADHADELAIRDSNTHLGQIYTLVKTNTFGLSADRIGGVVGAGTSWAVDLGPGGLLTGGPWTRFLQAGQRLPPPDPAHPGGMVTFQFVGQACVDAACNLAGRLLRAVATTIPADGTHPISAWVLVPPFAAYSALSTVDPWLFGGGSVGLLLIGLLTWWIVGRALRPMERIRSQLADITEHDLSRRLPVPETGDELQRWAITANETLDRLEQAMNRHRSFVDDAAHELRSPLAGLLSTLEVAAAHPDRADLPVAITAALADARRLQRLTDDLLLLARLDRTPPRHARVVDLDALVAEQVAERRFAGTGPAYRVSTVDVQVVGDEGQLERVLRNLLDNAARYARDEVRVTLSRRGDGVELEVLDDGPGIAAADRSRVFDRFARLDDARDQHHGGSGLGLAIARDIVRGHGGTVDIADSPTGARFVVHIPAASVALAGPHHLP
jgi:signal transduction histidine kinase